MPLIVSIAILAFLIILLSGCFFFSQIIQVRTIEVLPDGQLPFIRDAKFRLQSAKEIDTLINYERELRRLAYDSVDMPKDDSFYDDSDMRSNYFLVVVYNRLMRIPLLSARYYMEKSAIQLSLNGDSSGESKALTWLDLDVFSAEKYFLADRLSGNLNHWYFKKYRNYIFYKFYVEIVTKNPGYKMILMARSERHERLMTKYVRLGLNIKGYTMHHGRGHWVLLGDWTSMYQRKRKAMFSDMLLLLRLSLNTFKQWKN